MQTVFFSKSFFWGKGFKMSIWQHVRWWKHGSKFKIIWNIIWQLFFDEVNLWPLVNCIIIDTSLITIKNSWLHACFAALQYLGGCLRGHVRPMKMSQNGPFSLSVVCRLFCLDKNAFVLYLVLVFYTFTASVSKWGCFNIFNNSMWIGNWDSGAFCHI